MPDDFIWPEPRPQVQFDLNTQIRCLHIAAARLGLYDAADWLWKIGRERGVWPA